MYANNKLLFGMVAILLLAGILAAFGFAGDSGFELSKQEIVLRHRP